jgi:hypothetical protein
MEVLPVLRPGSNAVAVLGRGFNTAYVKLVAPIVVGDGVAALKAAEAVAALKWGAVVYVNAGEARYWQYAEPQ